MLLSFSLQNWMSFRDKAEFSMIATKEKQHSERLAKLPYKLRVLPIASLYGGNASGKSNLCNALRFAKNLVTKGTEPKKQMTTEPFMLDIDMENKPSMFTFNIFIDGKIYNYSFAVTKKEVLQEKLSIILGKKNMTLFERQRKEESYNYIFGDIKTKGRKNERQSLEVVSNNTRANQLFLYNTIDQNMKIYEPVFKWFDECLEFINPDHLFGNNMSYDKEKLVLKKINELIPRFDLGIDSVDLIEKKAKELGLPQEIASMIRKGSIERFQLNSEDFFVDCSSEQTIIKSVKTNHLGKNNNSVSFGYDKESDGTKRMLGLFPALIELCEKNSEKVIFADELDRSLHPNLTKQFLALFLNSYHSESRTQLIFTSHNTDLMDQDMFRRDEVWVTERDVKGNSSLYSFSEFSDKRLRYDKDIRKIYLQGRLGGIPDLRKLEYYDFNREAEK